ncbi:ISNCY family transposase [Salinisphaera sp. SWV1]|uniref:ISNCY family transposase n=1 Tax=Salinisphaera sp. SWV1 TaxID=3454139 RepID=UPI003F84ECAD
MREKRITQASIFDVFADHEIGIELQGMSRLLDAHPVLLDFVADDLGSDATTGRCGMTAESALRCAVLKQYRQLTYDELAFHLLDSASFQAFARLPVDWTPRKAALQANIAAIRDTTWEAIQAQLMGTACATGMERGRMWRLDSTVIDSPIHEPTDSSLLLDGVRVMGRLLASAEQLPGAPKLDWHNHHRRAKKRARAIRYTRGQDKKKSLYRDLIAQTRAMLGYLEHSAVPLQLAVTDAAALAAWQAEVAHTTDLIARVIDQTERRVFNDERVPAADKIVSLFEPHTDIIVKDRRDTHYGHKLNLTSGASGLIFDVVIEDGNPADAARFMPMLERHIERFGVPRQVAADGGYASRDNLAAAQRAGVEDVAFHKKRGLPVEDMVRSPWVYRKLRNFRAGIEAGISCLKRAYGLARCTWKGLDHFKAYVWSSVVAHNLVLMARLAPG